MGLKESYQKTKDSEKSKLKSDQNGIERILRNSGIDNYVMLKSDQNGIESTNYVFIAQWVNKVEIRPKWD